MVSAIDTTKNTLILPELKPKDMSVGEYNVVLVCLNSRESCHSGIIVRTSEDMFSLEINRIGVSGEKIIKKTILHSYQESIDCWVFRNTADKIIEGETELFIMS